MLFWIGIALVLLAIILLCLMAWRARALPNLAETEKAKMVNSLILLNFSGVFLGVMGLIFVLISKLFNS